MPEKIENLRRTLEELERELSDLETIDPAMRVVLEQTAHEIQAALEKQTADDLEHESLIERLQDVESQFQVSHPTLSSVVLKMVDVLGQMGI